jgi:Domain of unknown function (DUF4338)
VAHSAAQWRQAKAALGREHGLGAGRQAGDQLCQLVREEGKLVVPLRRFLVLEATRRPNPASQCPGAGLRELAGQWECHHGDRPLLAESFSDPESHAGTVYKATNWVQAGLTKGYSQDHTDYYIPNDRPKKLWLKELLGAIDPAAHALSHRFPASPCRTVAPPPGRAWQECRQRQMRPARHAVPARGRTPRRHDRGPRPEGRLRSLRRPRPCWPIPRSNWSMRWSPPIRSITRPTPCASSWTKAAITSSAPKKTPPNVWPVRRRPSRAPLPAS